MARCYICDKKAVSGSNVSHSQVHTKRRFKPNLQKVQGEMVCTRCIKTMNKKEIVDLDEAKRQIRTVRSSGKAT